MPFKDILVHVDGGEGCEARLDLAAAMAARHGGHMTAIHLNNLPHFPEYIHAEMGEVITKAQQEFSRELEEKTRAVFEDCVKRHGVPAEWRVAKGDALDIMALHARYADLTVLGQPEPDPTSEDAERIAHQLAMVSGRPVLISPYRGRFSNIGSRILVAWNGGREAALAVHDALGLLKQAQTVDVVAFNPRVPTGAHGGDPASDLGRHLSRHGVSVQTEVVATAGRDVGEAIMERAEKTGVDLIVMGSYGHSRLRELVLGGVTRHVLKSMTVPVFMAH